MKPMQNLSVLVSNSFTMVNGREVELSPQVGFVPSSFKYDAQ